MLRRDIDHMHLVTRAYRHRGHHLCRPSTVVLGVQIRHSPGKRLVVLHHGALIDVVVDAWLGAEYGNLHRLATCADGAMLLLDLNEYNHARQRHEHAARFESVRR